MIIENFQVPLKQESLSPTFRGGHLKPRKTETTVLGVTLAYLPFLFAFAIPNLLGDSVWLASTFCTSCLSFPIMFFILVTLGYWEVVEEVCADEGVLSTLAAAFSICHIYFFVVCYLFMLNTLYRTSPRSSLAAYGKEI